jgi:phospholipid/cholesterol/gamma-HCH transport system permease protein
MENKGNKFIRIMHHIGAPTLRFWHDILSCMEFIGETSLALVRFITGRAKFPWGEFGLFVQQTGINALPIMTLISVLVGMVLAYVGLVELRQFGVEIYIADMVSLGMAREMGALMTAIIMAGRSGAAFAAQLGTMEVNEELDAFKTLGLRPHEYLVLPRLLALTLMLPLLCVFSDLLGIIGGALVGCLGMGINWTQYLNRTIEAVSLTDFFVGIGKSFVFGLMVALAGCWRGLQCGRSAEAVGAVTTKAVVTGLVLIVVFDAIISVTLSYLGI